MIPDTLGNTVRLPEKKSASTDPFQLMQLLGYLQDFLYSEEEALQNLGSSFLGKTKFQEFKSPLVTKLKKNPFIYRRNRIWNKLLRMQAELKFAKEHYSCFNELTAREIEVLQSIGQGNSNPQIAKKLFISRYTVEQHRKHINCKLKIKSQAHLLRYCYAFDLL